MDIKQDFKSMKKALTIGELLVTMAIIGVIATLVLPGFLKDYHNRLYVTHLKKVYELLDAAVNQACIDNNVSYFYQTPYGQNGINPETGKYYQQDFLDKYLKKAADQRTNPFSEKYGVIGQTATYNMSLVVEHGWSKLAGGEAVSFYCNSNNTDYCLMRVDINSVEGPNIGGRDMFVIYVNKKTNELYDGYTVASCGGVNSDEDTGKPSLNKVNNYYGYGCLGRIIRDNWEMKY